MSDKEMTEKKLVVCGDVCIDWYQWPVPKQEKGHNWRLSEGSGACARPGGALMIADMLEVLGHKEVSAPELTDIEKISPVERLHSNIRIIPHPATTGAAEVTYRIAESLGFTGPVEKSPEPMAPARNPTVADYVILDDSGNGYRDDPRYWPEALNAANNPWVVLKMARPLFEGALWEKVTRDHSSRLLVLVTANDLRSSGVFISRSLSWERTLLETVRECRKKNIFTDVIQRCHALVIRFGLEGALLCQAADRGADFWAVFTPKYLENSLFEIYPGQIFGLSSAFTAAFAHALAEARGTLASADAVDAVKAGLHASQALLANGIPKKPDTPEPDFALQSRMAVKKKRPLGVVVIPRDLAIRDDELNEWSILKNTATVRAESIEKAAGDVLTMGEERGLPNIPMGRFGALTTVDRTEIESFQGVKDLFKGYLCTPQTRPVSIAVFGAPGSGKSFGVKQIAKIIGKDKIVINEFNLSQFQSLADLTAAFQKVRDVVLTGHLPLVFFDEFDSALDDKPFAWLRYFLAPMQDGEFKEGESMHPIGKAIFVFAGGVFSSFAQFSATSRSDDGAFKKAKGPDFISRLKGYVDITGPNPVDAEDVMFIIRRATLLRSMLKRKYGSLFNDNGALQIDTNVAKALLLVPHYKHGARSIEAIIDTSGLDGKRKWHRAYLPPREQLGIHVEIKPFMEYVMGAAKLGIVRELIARAIHEKYVQAGLDRGDDAPRNTPSMQPWDNLAETYRQSNRTQADDYAEKLASIGCTMQPVIGRTVINQPIHEDEVERLAREEHQRWMKERESDGWTYGATRDERLKLHPLMVPWDALPDDAKERSRDPVRSIPDILQRCNVEIVKPHPRDVPG